MKAIAGLFVILAFGAAAVGWIMNLVAVIHAAGATLSHVTVMLVLRIVGIFIAPLGAILGWF